MSTAHDAAIGAAYQGKNYELCLSLVKESLRQNPFNVNYQLMKAACGAFLAVEFEENVEMLNKIIADDPKNGLAFFALGNCYYYEGEIGECQEYFKKAIEMNSGALKANQLKQKASIIMSALCDADARFEKDEVFTSMEILNAIHLIDPTNKKIREKIERISQYYLDVVVKRLEASVNSELDKHNAELEKHNAELEFEVLAEKAETMIAKKNVKEAMSLIEQMEKCDPDAEAVICLKGYAHYMAGQLKEAVLCFDKAVKINLNNVKARKLLMKATKLDKLIDDAEEASRIDKDSAKAIALLTEALKVDSNNTVVNQAIYLQRSYHNFNVLQFSTATEDFKKFQEGGITIEEMRKMIPSQSHN